MAVILFFSSLIIGKADSQTYLVVVCPQTCHHQLPCLAFHYRLRRYKHTAKFYILIDQLNPKLLCEHCGCHHQQQCLCIFDYQDSEQSIVSLVMKHRNQQDNNLRGLLLSNNLTLRAIRRITCGYLCHVRTIMTHAMCYTTYRYNLTMCTRLSGPTALKP